MEKGMVMMMVMEMGMATTMTIIMEMDELPYLDGDNSSLH